MQQVAEDLIEVAIEEEQARWQEAIYKLLIDETGDDTIDGGACDSGDPLDVSLAEIEQSITRLKDRVEWYKRRIVMLQKEQSRMRDPERTLVCDIIANGQLLPEG